MPLILASSPFHFTCSPISSSKSAALLSSFATAAVALCLTSPLPSLASFPPASQISLTPPTPYTQSQTLNRGLEDGRIRPCPSANPGCVSTNPKSSSFSFPLVIPEDSLESAVQKLRDAIVRTQRNVRFEVDEDTPSGGIRKGICTRISFPLSAPWCKYEFGFIFAEANDVIPLNLETNYPDAVSVPMLDDKKYNFRRNDFSKGRFLRVEVDGGFGRDVMEFLVKGDIVAYRTMATKVTYIYPFTTALGDSKGQEERINKIKAELGWSSPSFESMDSS